MKTGFTYDDVLIVPGECCVVSRSRVDTSTRISRHYNISIPIIAANMESVVNPEVINILRDYGANGVLHRFNSNELRIEQAKKLKKNSNGPRMVAVGVNDKFDFLKALIEYCDIVVVDVANADSIFVRAFIEQMLFPLKEKYKFDIVVGNIATAKAAERFCKLGVDGLKVGIGPGSACTTRLVTGCGIPQLTAIIDVYSVARHYGIPIIADGGIKNYGDLGKALVAGANTIMVGKEVALCKDNTASDIPGQEGVKHYHGSASLGSNGKTHFVEGVSATIKVNEVLTLKEKIERYKEALQSTVSYCGGYHASDIIGLQQFIKCTPNILIENGTRLH